MTEGEEIRNHIPSCVRINPGPNSRTEINSILSLTRESSRTDNVNPSLHWTKLESYPVHTYRVRLRRGRIYRSCLL